MTIEYTLNRDGFVAASRLAMHGRSPGRRVRLWIFRALGAAFILIGGVLLSQPGSRLGGAYVMLCGIFLATLPLASNRAARWRYSRMTALHGRYSVTFDDDGMHIVAPSGESRLLWRLWDSYGEDQRSLVLGQRGSRMFMPIPKIELRPAEIEEMRVLFKAHIKRA